MLLTSHHFSTNISSSRHHIAAVRHRLQNPTTTSSLPITSRHLTAAFPLLRLSPRSSNLLVVPTRCSRLGLGVYDDDDGFVRRKEVNSLNFDCFLSIVEFVCLVSSAVLTIGFAASCAVSGLRKAVVGVFGERVLVWGLVMMVCGVLVGALIRRRQWSRVCMETVKGGAESFNLVERIEKLEEDVRSSATIIRALSRQLEKLGIRFRVTRKSLKDPISETAALAQKNSEATRALAAQEDILERELGEVHKVLLAMQEQQYKQLDLILAVGRASKIIDDTEKPEQEHDTKETRKSLDDKKIPEQKLNTKETRKSLDDKKIPEQKLDPKEKPESDQKVAKKMETSPANQALGSGKKRK